MQVTISGQHVEVSDTLREYVRRKLTRINRHFGPMTRSHVALYLTQNYHGVEPTAHTKCTQWHASAEDKDMYANFHVVGKLDRQAIKHKEEVVEHHQDEGGLKNCPNT